MIGLPSETRVWLASGATDIRRGFDGLALLVQEVLKRDPHCGHLFVFRGKRGGLIKVLWYDGQGMCLLAKRLERGRFVWPRTEGEAVTISAAQLGYLRWRASTGACHSGPIGRRRRADAAERCDMATRRSRGGWCC
jgi:transposase